MKYYSVRRHRRIIIFTSNKNPIEKLDIPINLMQLLLPQVSRIKDRQNCKWKIPKIRLPPKKVSKIRSKRRRNEKEKNSIKSDPSSLDEIRPSIEKAAGGRGEIWKKYIFSTPHPAYVERLQRAAKWKDT